MAHPYQSAEDLSVHRRSQYSSAGANSNVALRTYVNESDVHLYGDTALFTPASEETVSSGYQNESNDTKGDEDQNALRRQFEQLDVSQLQLKVDAVRTQDYPFLSDIYTMSVIKRSRVLFLLRGPSGLGKSTIASVIAAKYGANAVVCSADDYFMHNGIYRFGFLMFCVVFRFSRNFKLFVFWKLWRFYCFIGHGLPLQKYEPWRN